ncbi:MAG TPA: rhodanese-like domain-containing protein [Planctomycetota bacterium]|nr:rhodanese-like domain-containing protein [Planctomycetota bacterium]
MKFSFAVLALVFAFAGAGVMAADKAEDIKHEDLVKAVNEKKVVLIDCNGSESYKSGHIPGAIDFATAKAELDKKLPADKSTLIVAYCGNENCNAYQAGAEAAKKLGYTNVKHYSGGIAGWKKAGEKTAAAN